MGDVLLTRHRRDEADPVVEVRRHGEHRIRRVDGGAVGVDGDGTGGTVVGHTVAHVGDGVDLVDGGGVRLVPVDLTDGRVQDDLAAELTDLLGQGDGDGLHAADDAPVEDEVLVDEVGEGPGGRRHEHGLQRREGVGGLGQHAGRHVDRDVVDGLLVVGVLVEPGAEGDRVELLGLRGSPGGLGPDLGGELVHDADELLHLGQGVVGDGQAVAGVGVPGAVGGDVDGVALAVAREGLQVELLGELHEAGLVGGDPLATDLDEVLPALGIEDVAVPGASADAVARLDDGDLLTGLGQGVCGGQAGGAGADDDDV